MTAPLIADLFCCAGGAGVGYARAGFRVYGVDIKGRPNYPFMHHQGDAVAFLRQILAGEWKFDAVHASPPCQAACNLTRGTNASRGYEYPDFYEEVRDLIRATGLPGVIENPRSRPDAVLCGEMFGLGVLRHRNFELVNWSTESPKHVKHRGRVRGWNHGKWQDGPYIAAYGKGGGKGNVREMQDAMGIDWTDVHEELTEAIPPAYTEWIGARLMEHLRGEMEAAA
jgi:DNA (cytosine-5)-methyltransferase 1